MQVGRRRKGARRGGREGGRARGESVEMTKSYITSPFQQIGLFFHTASFRWNLPNRAGHVDLHNCTGWHGPPVVKCPQCGLLRSK